MQMIPNFVFPAILFSELPTHQIPITVSTWMLTHNMSKTGLLFPVPWTWPFPCCPISVNGIISLSLAQDKNLHDILAQVFLLQPTASLSANLAGSTHKVDFKFTFSHSCRSAQIASCCTCNSLLLVSLASISPCASLDWFLPPPPTSLGGMCNWVYLFN